MLINGKDLCGVDKRKVVGDYSFRGASCGIRFYAGERASVLCNRRMESARHKDRENCSMMHVGDFAPGNLIEASELFNSCSPSPIC